MNYNLCILYMIAGPTKAMGDYGIIAKMSIGRSDLKDKI
jgi:hypothetical protein